MEHYDDSLNYSFEQSQNSEPNHDEKPKAKEKKGISKGGLTAIIISVALVAGACGASLPGAIEKLSDKSKAKQAMSEQSVSESDDKNYSLKESNLPAELKSNKGDKTMTPAEVYKANVDAVVGIRTEAITTNIWGQLTEASSAGTGFVLSEDGYIVTNNHVINNGKTVTVALNNGEQYEAKIIAGDSVNDVALLKIEKDGLQTVSIGRSEDLIVGEEVVAIGNPLGELTFTMTHGYISALDRYINTSGTPINMLQTDAAINAGNSGGPLFDMNGNVIAMNTAKPSASTANGTTVEGIGFAIPISDVLDIVYDLEQNGKVTGRAFLGITPRDLDKSTADTYHLPIGVYVDNVTEDSCADKADIEAGDIILEINGKEVTKTSELRAELNRLKAGDTVEVTVYRKGAEVEMEVTLDEAPAQEEKTETEQQIPNNGGYYTIDPSKLFPGFSFGF